MYGLFGKFKTYPGQRDAMIDILLKAADGLREMESCYLYVINAAPDDPDAIWVNEIWQSKEAHDASLQNEAAQTLIASARPLIAGGGERFEVRPVGGKGVPDAQ